MPVFVEFEAWGRPGCACYPDISACPTALMPQEKLSAHQAETMAEFKALEEAALRVLEVVSATQAQLGAKEGELAAIKAEYEQKQKEVRGGPKHSSVLGAEKGRGCRMVWLERWRPSKAQYSRTEECEERRGPAG